MKNVDEMIKDMRRIEFELRELKRCVSTYVDMNSHPNLDQRIWDVRTGIYKAQWTLEGSLKNFKEDS